MTQAITTIVHEARPMGSMTAPVETETTVPVSPRAYRLEAINGIRHAWGHPELDCLARVDGEPEWEPLAQAPRPNRTIPGPTPVDSIAMTWSRGEVVLPSSLERMQARKAARKDVADMTLAELMASQDVEIESISKAVFRETGRGALSLDQPSSHGDDGDEVTLADTLIVDPTDNTVLLTVKPYEQMSADEQELADAFKAGVIRSRGKRREAALEVLDPDVRDAIDYERWAAKCGPVTREGFRRNENGTYSFFSLMGRRLSAAEFIARKSDFVKDFLARIGRDSMPKAAEFDAKRRWYQTGPIIGFRKAWYDLVYLGQDEHRPNRDDLLDLDEHGSHVETYDPYRPSLAVFLHRARLEIAREESEALQRNHRWAAVLTKKWFHRKVSVRAQRLMDAWIDQHADEAYPVDRYHSERDRLRARTDAFRYGEPRDPAETELGFDFQHAG